MDLHHLRLPIGVRLQAPARSGAGVFARVEVWTLALAALVGLFIVLHLLWFINTPADLDSFNFVLGVRDFDVVHNQPHPPGAPVYIAAGKVATGLWMAAGLPFEVAIGPEAAALAGLSLLCAVVGVIVLWRLPRWQGESASRLRHTAVLVASGPLFWLIAARPISDMVGLVMVLATYHSLASRRTCVAALLSGVAAGVRVQTALLTVPLLFLSARDGQSWKARAAAAGCFTVAILSWVVPLIVSTGGADSYWGELSKQAGSDWVNPLMLAAAPTLRHGVSALVDTFVRPWGNPFLAALMLGAAACGGYVLVRRSARAAAIVAVAFGPYLVSHLFFQETSTVRYALPISVAVGYLAATGLEAAPRPWRGALLAAFVAANLIVSAVALQAFKRTGSPPVRLLTSMSHRATTAAPAFVAAHENLKLHHLERILPDRPWTTVRVQEPYEWRALASYWKRGATTPIWFVADPRRTDLILMDRRSREVLGTFGWDSQAAWILRGVRPKALTWLELRPPAWIAISGFALTPATGGVAVRDREGPAFGGAVALISRYATGAVMAIGGRHVGVHDDPAVQVIAEIDGRPVARVMATPHDRQYRALVHLRPQQLAGDSPYATVTIRSEPIDGSARRIPVTVEHFDYQPEQGTLLTFWSHWHEPELRRRTGLTWRWAGPSASVLVHRQPGTTAELILSGDAPLPRGFRPNVIRVSAGGRTLDEFSAAPAFSRRILIPADLGEGCDLTVTLTSETSFVPHAVGQSEDRRELSFRAFTIGVDPVSFPN